MSQLDPYRAQLKTNKNLILTGAPGTGKTYMYPCTCPVDRYPQSTLVGYGGDMMLVPLYIPTSSTWEDFIQNIKDSETVFVNQITNHIPHALPN